MAIHTKESILKTVKTIVQDMTHLEFNEITLEADIENELGFDSIDKLECLMEIEEDFDIEIPDHDASIMKTLNDVVVYLEKLLL